jgi:putative transposase
MDSQSHVRWECLYHIVIVPKYRKRVLYGKIRSRLREILRELAKRVGIEIKEGNVMPDHLLSLKITLSYSNYYLK